jgi:hypothetical protein
MVTMSDIVAQYKIISDNLSQNTKISNCADVVTSISIFIGTARCADTFIFENNYMCH